MTPDAPAAAPVRRTGPARFWRERLAAPVALAGGLSTVIVAALVFGALALVWSAATGDGESRGFSTSDLRALRFTALQASLSALLSVGLALPLARALARRRFPGRAAMLTVLGAPFLLPVVVAILGIVAVWGRSGWLSDLGQAIGAGRLDIYGLTGVLIAHVFFNLPLATRLLLEAYRGVPVERWRLAAQLGLEGRALFAHVEWPALRPALPGALALVFLVCATSFAVVLFLGGGPRAATLELAIYEATAYSFDLARAARLAALQFGLCAIGALAAFALGASERAAPGLGAAPDRWDGRSGLSRGVDGAVIGAAALFLGAPLLAAALRGLVGLGELQGGAGTAVALAAARTLGVSLAATALCLALALPLAALSSALDRLGRSGHRRTIDLISLAPLAASPFVLAVAAILALRPLADIPALALPLTAMANALAALPFAVRVLAPALTAAHAERGRLADSLGLRGWMRLRALYLPRLRRPLGLAAGLAAALSAGDLGVIALFSAPDAPTLPLLMQQFATGRRIDAAFGAALCLTALAFVLFALFDIAGRSDAGRRRGRA